MGSVATGASDVDIGRVVAPCEHSDDGQAGLYRLYRAPIRAFCAARLGSTELAEDAVQETFTRMLATDECALVNPRAWLYAVARNVCADIQRGRRREILDGLPDTSPALMYSRDAADEARLAREARNGLLALRRLRPRYRAALILREVHGLPVREVAESLGMREGATHTLLSRARNAFARTYAETSGRPEACMDALVLLFRGDRVKLSDADSERLEFHLASCPWCREQSETDGRTRLSMLVPALGAPASPLHGLIARVAHLATPLSDTVRHVIPLGEQTTQVAARVFTPLLIAAALAAPSTAPPGPPLAPERPSAVAEHQIAESHEALRAHGADIPMPGSPCEGSEGPAGVCEDAAPQRMQAAQDKESGAPATHEATNNADQSHISLQSATSSPYSGGGSTSSVMPGDPSSSGDTGDNGLADENVPRESSSGQGESGGVGEPSSPQHDGGSPADTTQKSGEQGMAAGHQSGPAGPASRG